MATRLRYGLIGAGMMAREHVRNLALVAGSEVVALSDPAAESRESCAVEIEAAFGGRPHVFETHDALLAADIVDALIIASPNDTHASILHDIFTMRRKMPVLCEKPVCTNPQDIVSLATAAATHAAPIWVAMEYRYMPPVAALIGHVRDGTIGPLRMLSIREHRFPFLQKVGDWNRFNVRTGGTLVEKCCHFFDLMRLITGRDAIRVFASGGADVNHRDERYNGQTPDILDNAFVIVDFEGGVRAALDLCMFAEGAYFQEEITVTGDTGRVVARIPGVERFWQGGGQHRAAEIEISPRSPQNPMLRKIDVDPAILKAGDHFGSTYYQHVGFRAAILDGQPVAVSMQDGLAAVEIGLAAEQSVRERRAIELPRQNAGPA